MLIQYVLMLSMILNYFEVRDLEKLFSVGKTTVYYWIRKGWLPANKLSISNIFTQEDLKSFVEIMPKYKETLNSYLAEK